MPLGGALRVGRRGLAPPLPVEAVAVGCCIAASALRMVLRSSSTLLAGSTSSRSKTVRTMSV